MKANHILLIALSIATILACDTKPKGEKAHITKDEAVSDIPHIKTEDVQTYQIDTSQSLVYWEGSKPTGTHNGIVKIEDGEFGVLNGQLVNGKVVIDMTSIENHDLEGEWKQKLENHLRSADFFEVDKYPRASFITHKITPLTNDKDGATHEATGTLIVKGISKPIKFKLKFHCQDNTCTIESLPFIIDRTEFGIKYKSKKFFDNLKDKFINDEIGLRFKVVGKPAEKLQ